MAFTIQMDETDNTSPVMIKVIGIGGGGCNALKQMMDFDLHGVELIVANTDKQVLQENPIQNKLQLGVKTTRGMGAGSKPEVGRAAAEEDRDKIRDALNGADMVFIAAGMGGGTGTGAAPVIANVARDMGILTVARTTASPPSWAKTQPSSAPSKPWITSCATPCTASPPSSRNWALSTPTSKTSKPS